jgi:hypothetical protein
MATNPKVAPRHDIVVLANGTVTGASEIQNGGAVPIFVNFPEGMTICNLQIKHVSYENQAQKAFGPSATKSGGTIKIGP